MVNYDVHVVGARVRAIRKQMGWSQECLAEMLDCSVPYLSYIENGYKNMSLEMLVKVCQILGVTADELLFANRASSVDSFDDAIMRLLSQCTPFEKKVILESLKSIIRINQNNRNHSA